MKHLYFALTLSIAPLQLMAEEQATTFLAQESCRNFVRFDNQTVVMGKNNGLLTIASNGDTKNYQLGQMPKDALIVDDKIIALVGSELWIIDQNNAGIEKHFESQKFKNPNQLLPQEMPRAIRRAGQNILIAHGTMGISIFNLPTRSLQTMLDINNQQPLKGMAVDIAVKDQTAYVLVDNYQVNPLKPSQEFRGLILLNLETFTILKRLGGLDPGASALAIHDNDILVSFAGMPFWRLPADSSQKQNLSHLAHAVWNFGRDGHSIGHFSADLDSIWTCHWEKDSRTSKPSIYSRSDLNL